jgi:hypothetical protein
MYDQNSELVTVANKCAAVCEHCASSCLASDHLQPMVECVVLDRDCADLCRLVATLASRGSRFTENLKPVLALICKACGDECAKHDTDHCRKCAAACKACEQVCSQ